MPPKARFSREQIIETALQIVREEGMERLTARTLGKRLGCSVCPIFTLFESMGEVQSEVTAAAKQVYDRYVRTGFKETPAFKGVGMQYIRFAGEEPKLFHLLFMSEACAESPARFLPMIDEHYSDILRSVRETYGLGEEDAKALYVHMWIYTHGIASLYAMRAFVFSSGEVSRLLTEVCTGLLREIKGGVCHA